MAPDDEESIFSDSSSENSDSEGENEVLAELFASDDEDDDFAGFEMNMRWRSHRFEKNIPEFTLQAEIVQFTNKNAVTKGAPNWKPVTAEELKAFLAMLIIGNDMLVVPY